MISLLGIVAGMAFFIYCAFKNVNVVLSALASSIIIFLFSDMPIMSSLNDVYMSGFVGLIKAYFLLFALSATLGKIIADGGAAKKIAISLTGIANKSERHQQYLGALSIPLIYLLLSYVGISGFVLVFTVVPIGKELFENCNIPWRLYCYGGCAAVGASMLVGSLQPGNIYAMDVAGTTTMAGVGLSLVAVLVYFGVTALMIRRDLKIAAKNKETFQDTGAGILKSQIGQGLPVEKLPSLFLSLLPLITMIVLTAAFHLNVLIALFIGCVMGLVLFRGNIQSVKNTVGDGLTSCFGPVITVAATFAVSSVIKATPGFALFTGFLGNLPPLLEGVGLGMITSFIIASSSSGIPAFGPAMIESFTSAGLSLESAHRLITIANFTGIPPHSAGISNASAVTKIPYSVCMKVYVLGTIIPGFAALLASLLCIQLGLFL